MDNLIANWPAPANIRALTTTRMIEDARDNNLALHVDDSPQHVAANRETLKTTLQLPAEPIWLNQTHTNRCVLVENDQVDRNADAAITRVRHYPLAILTADCLPIVICDEQGLEIAAIHAGWRGLANGIIENTIELMQSQPSSCLAWIGPAICEACYETGAEVLDQFKARYRFAPDAFSNHRGRLHANLAKMAELILRSSGLTAVYQSGACTYEATEQFYSYRRAAKTGRMATLIWFRD